MTRDESLIKDLREEASARGHNYDEVEELLNEAAQRLEQIQAYHKPVQDMSLRELFDHVAIVNDAVRAALAGHPGCEPVRREVE